MQLKGGEGIPLARAEQRVIGTDHAHIGAWLGVTWNLPQELVQVIRWHHSPDKASPQYRSLVWLISTANALVSFAAQDLLQGHVHIPGLPWTAPQLLALQQEVRDQALDTVFWSTVDG